MSAEQPIAAPASGPAAPPPARRRRRWAWRVLAAAGVLLLLAVGAIVWVVLTPEGARLVLTRATHMMGEGATLEGVEGRIGGLLRIRSIEISRPDMYVLI